VCTARTAEFCTPPGKWHDAPLNGGLAMPGKITPILGEVIELMYPDTYGRLLAEFIGVTENSVRHYVKTRKLHKGRNRKPLGYTTLYNQRRLVVKMNDDHPQQHRRFAFAHVLAWEKAAGQKVPKGHVIINIDGDPFNLEPDNLYCLSRGDLLNWARFVMKPVDVWLDRLWREIMALDTSDKVKQKLLDVLEQVTDPDQKPDLIRQRAVCETVQTLVNMLRVEVAYIDALDGDGRIPFLEDVRQEAEKRKQASKLSRGLLAGPAADHPWRGLERRSD
jgi:hypothetical protein